MAVTPQYKVNQFAKDLGIKTKDVQDVLAQKGLEVKTQTALSPEEFGVLFDSLTRANQLDNIGDYLDGVTYIPSRKKDEKTAPKTEDKPQAKAEVKTEVKVEPKAEVKAEPKAEIKAEPKVEPKVEVKAEPKVEPKAEVKAEPKVEPKVEVKAEPKVEPKVEVKAEPKVEEKPAAQAAPARPAARPLYTGNPYTRTPGAYTGDPYHSNRPAGTKVPAAENASRTHRSLYHLFCFVISVFEQKQLVERGEHLGGITIGFYLKPPAYAVRVDDLSTFKIRLFHASMIAYLFEKCNRLSQVLRKKRQRARGNPFGSSPLWEASLRAISPCMKDDSAPSDPPVAAKVRRVPPNPLQGKTTRHPPRVRGCPGYRWQQSGVRQTSPRQGKVRRSRSRENRRGARQWRDKRGAYLPYTP